jgi:hypothetical protein
MGVGNGVGVAEGVGVGTGVGVGVGVGVGKGDGVTLQAFGASIPTVTGVPVLKKPIVAAVKSGARSESKRKLYSVPHRSAFAF